MTNRKPPGRLVAGLILAIFVGTPIGASAQTLTITNGVQTYTGLTNTTVTMTGQSALYVTGASSPIPGSIINLNSANAWFFLPNIRPSAVVSNYLGQIRVSGAGAVADSNVRVVEYGAGAVVIPHAPSFQPLQVFSAPHFTGSSAQYSQYTYYTGSGLGVMDTNISSFRLKRGYMAVVAADTSGVSSSQSYVAQDGDLDVGVLPSTLDNQIRFIYVTPWRWVAKKGSCDIAPGDLNAAWWYNWSIDQTSSRDIQYVAIKQQPYWPGLDQDWASRGVNHLSGYNEPDNPVEDAYKNLNPQGSVTNAVARWPELLGTGLRVGAPAVTDGGYSWIVDFVNQADAAGYRIDYVPVHYYRSYPNNDNAQGAANNLYNYLKSIHDATHRPIWLTEFNNGANWTSDADPTFDQNKNVIEAMINMMDGTPWIERYAIYSDVEDVRKVYYNAGGFTPMGAMYRDHVSPLSYVQAMPDNGTRSIAQFLFETNTLDSSGYGNNGLAVGPPAFTAGHSGQAVVLDGTNNYIQLPPNVADSANFSFAAWVYWNGGGSWQRIFDFGNDTSHCLFLTPSSGSGTLRFAINNGSGEQIVETTGMTSGVWRHVAVTLSGGVAKLYTNGVLAASASGFTVTPSNILPTLNYLGKSQWPDPLFSGKLDDVQIADYAFTAAQIAALQTNLPPQFTTNIYSGIAVRAMAYNNSLAGAATDPNGGTLTFSKLNGPAWLNVSTSGTLTGTPIAGDVGTNFFTVRVTDPAGASAYAILTISTLLNPVWNADASGNWSDTNKWLASFVANGAGFTADFSTLNITADRTVTLDTSRSLGALKFGDVSGAQNWNLSASGGSVLTLNSGSSAPPSIAVTNTATISAPLAGANGFAKTGPGLLVLSNTNALTGTVSVGGGAVRLNHSRALENNLVNLPCAGSNALKFGPITTAAIGGISGLNDVWLTNSSPAAVTLTNGNTASTEFNGAFRGPGGLVKTGTGTLTLGGTNTYTGATTIAAGTVRFGSSTNYIATLQPVLWMSFDQAGGGIVTNQGKGGWAMNGTLTGTNVSVVSGGRFGKALMVSNGPASTGYVLVPNAVVPLNITAATWTVAMWLKTSTPGGVYLYQGDGGWEQNNTEFYLENGTAGDGAGTHGGGVRWGQGWESGTSNVVDGAWHLVVMTCNNGTKAHYVDGAVDALAINQWSGAAAGGQMWIGGAAPGADSQVGLNGLIDEVCVFDRALTQAQIRAIYTNAPVVGKLSAASSVNIASGAIWDLSGIAQSVASLSDFDGAGGLVTNNSATPVMLVVGNNSASAPLFSGEIADASAAGAVSLVKSGVSTQVLGGVNAFRGPTTVSNGTLIVNGSLGTNAVSVRGGTLAGTGAIAGAVTVYSSGTLSPGSNAIGALTVANSLTLSGTSLIELDRDALTNDVVLGLTTINYGGTLVVTNLTGTLMGGDSFKLFDAAGFNGTFADITCQSPLGLGVGLVFNPTNGTLSAVQTVAVNPTNLTWSVSGTYLTLSWPDDHIGWRLWMQTNNLASGISLDTNDWWAVPGSDTTNQMTLPLDLAQPAGFYRLIFP